MKNAGYFTPIMQPNDLSSFEEAELLTQWALDRAWKIAVRTAGIIDWSRTKQSNPNREHQVELMQMEIAKMILSQN